jgi:hypothetical protein
MAKRKTVRRKKIYGGAGNNNKKNNTEKNKLKKLIEQQKGMLPSQNYAEKSPSPSSSSSSSNNIKNDKLRQIRNEFVSQIKQMQERKLYQKYDRDGKIQLIEMIRKSALARGPANLNHILPKANALI